MHDLKRIVKALLLADDEILEVFQERFTLTPISRSTSGYSRGTCKSFHSQSTFQVEGNGQSGMVRAVETQEGVKTLEVYFGQKIIDVTMDKDLANIIRALILADDQLHQLFGEKIRVTQLARGDNITPINGQEEGIAKTFASFQVEGSKQIGVASVATLQYHATEILLYVDDKTFRMEPPQKTVKSFLCYPRCTTTPHLGASTAAAAVQSS